MKTVRSFFPWLSAIVVAVLASGCCRIDRPYQPTGCTSGTEPVFGTWDGDGPGAGNCTGASSCQEWKNNLTCRSGCGGEVYWGEWISDPPDECDPCDGCGNWVGPRCCPPNFWDIFNCGAGGFWGWRCGAQGGCGNGSCSACGGEAELSGEIMEESIVPAGPTEAIEEKSAPKQKLGPTEAKPDELLPPQPTPDSTSAHHHHRHAHSKPLLLQPAKSPRGPSPTPARGTSPRTRNL